MEPTWTDERIAKLVELAALPELSMEDITTQFNVSFGTRLTRSSIIGKLSRMKVVRAVSDANRRTLNNKTPRRRTAQPWKPAAVPWKPAMVSVPNTTLQMRDDGSRRPVAQRLNVEPCRWPMVDGSECGKPATVCAYCDEHALKAYRGMPTAKRLSVFNKTDTEWSKKVQERIDEEQDQ
jgi:hypothetical protein